MLVTDEDYNAVLPLMSPVALPDDIDLLLGSRPAWQRDAACWGADPALFFPERGQSVEPAKRLCAGCSVAEECRSYAEAAGPLRGIWGGVSERVRTRGERPKPTVAPVPTPARRRRPPRPARPRPPSMFEVGSQLLTGDAEEGPEIVPDLSRAPVDVLEHLAATGTLF